MILVLLGTQDKQFDRLLKEVSDLKEQGKIKEDVVAQVGCSNFRSKYIKSFDFVSKDEINDLIDKASLVIAHGGVGIITECLNKNKKVIVAPRLAKYKEHTNDHQLEITKEFAKNKYIIPFYENDNLEDKIKEAKKLKVKKYKSNNDKFINSVKKYIDEL